MILYCPNCFNKNSEEEDFAIETEIEENLQFTAFCHVCKSRYFVKLYKFEEVKIPSRECESCSLDRPNEEFIIYTCRECKKVTSICRPCYENLKEKVCYECFFTKYV